MGAMTAAIAGGVVWTYLFSYTINYAVSWKTDSDTVKQRLIITILTVLGGASFYAVMNRDMIDGALAYGLGGLCAYFAFVKRGESSAGKMKPCPKCLEENFSDSAFCEACGAGLKSDDPATLSPEMMFDKKAISDRTFICPNCATHVKASDRVCPTCNNPLPAQLDESPSKRPRNFWSSPI